jgi:hypothetical protein
VAKHRTTGARFGGWVTGTLWVASACSETRGPPPQPWVIPQPDGDDDGGDGEGDADVEDGDDSGVGASSSFDDGADDAPSSHTAVTQDSQGDEGSSGNAGSSEVGDAPPDSPYMGDWDIGDCQNDIVAAADVLADISLSDQFGESVRLYDFCHKAILLTDGSFW